jgi:hypothetical protein
LTFNPGGKLDVTRQRLVLGHLAGLVGIDVDFPSASLGRQRRRGVARTIRSVGRYSDEAACGDYSQKVSVLKWGMAIRRLSPRMVDQSIATNERL